MEPMQSHEAAKTKNTLLLVFVHGFKGNDDTFGSFPTYLASLLSEAVPDVSVTTAIYPAYDTRGELGICVSKFRNWLVEKVIDIEVEKRTVSPTVSPSVRVMLCGHSMGGILAAETLLGIVWDEIKDVDKDRLRNDSKQASVGGFILERLDNSKGLLIFPRIQGILAFDTPYLGIAPGVVAHGAEGQWQAGKAWFEGASGLMAAATATGANKATHKADPDTSDTKDLSKSQQEESQKQTKGGWGKYAAIAGAASVVAAAGSAAAYLKKDEIYSGISWATSHLEFVGTLARPEDLKKRLDAVSEIGEQYDVGFANLYTCLAQNVSNGQWSSKALGSERTFCNIPQSDKKKHFHKQVNKSASSEIVAHMDMFDPKVNSSYYSMGELARDLLCEWMQSH